MIKQILLDKAINSIQRHLQRGLPWLNAIFGRAYKITEQSDNGQFTYPAIYQGDGDYLSMLPNDMFGNFCWFDIYDPQRVITITPRRYQTEIKGALIFWLDITSMYEDVGFLYPNFSGDFDKSFLVGRASLGQVNLNTLKDSESPVILTGHLYTEEIKNEILKALTSNVLSSAGKIEIDEVYERFENIYKGYSTETVGKQYFLHPYAGLRIEFTLTLKELC